MKDAATTEIRKLDAEAARLLKRRQRHEAQAAQLAKAEAAHEAAAEAAILSSIRDAGLTKLPLKQVLATIRAVGAAAAAKDVPGNGALAATAAGGSRYDSEEAAAREVFVKISRNVSPDNRVVFDEAGLGWNGKLGGWKGWVDSTAVEKLRSVFVGRVEILGKQEPLSQAGSEDEGVSPVPPAPDSGSGALATPADGEGIGLGLMTEAGMISDVADATFDNPDAAVDTTRNAVADPTASPPRFGALPRPPHRPPGL